MNDSDLQARLLNFRNGAIMMKIVGEIAICALKCAVDLDRRNTIIGCYRSCKCRTLNKMWIGVRSKRRSRACTDAIIIAQLANEYTLCSVVFMYFCLVLLLFCFIPYSSAGLACQDLELNLGAGELS